MLSLLMLVKTAPAVAVYTVKLSAAYHLHLLRQSASLGHGFRHER